MSEQTAEQQVEELQQSQEQAVPASDNPVEQPVQAEPEAKQISPIAPEGTKENVVGQEISKTRKKLSGIFKGLWAKLKSLFSSSSKEQ